jgi:hypothetical protein
MAQTRAHIAELRRQLATMSHVALMEAWSRLVAEQRSGLVTPLARGGPVGAGRPPPGWRSCSCVPAPPYRHRAYSPSARALPVAALTSLGWLLPGLEAGSDGRGPYGRQRWPRGASPTRSRTGCDASGRQSPAETRRVRPASSTRPEDQVPGGGSSGGATSDPVAGGAVAGGTVGGFVAAGGTVGAIVAGRGEAETPDPLTSAVAVA